MPTQMSQAEIAERLAALTTAVAQLATLATHNVTAAALAPPPAQAATVSTLKASRNVKRAKPRKKTFYPEGSVIHTNDGDFIDWSKVWHKCPAPGCDTEGTVEKEFGTRFHKGIERLQSHCRKCRAKAANRAPRRPRR
jgi:hypothetical protein